MRMRMQQTDEQDEDELAQLTPEQIKELLEKSVEVDMDMDEFDMSAVQRLPREPGEGGGQPAARRRRCPDDAPTLEYPASQSAPAARSRPTTTTSGTSAPPTTSRAGAPCASASSTRARTTSTRRRCASTPAWSTRRSASSSCCKPETFRKLKKLEDGEDIDLDAAIEFIVQKRAGHGDIPKIYWRRNKIERDVAVAFLLDMSASTDEEIEKRRPRDVGGRHQRPAPLLPVAGAEPRASS